MPPRRFLEGAALALLVAGAAQAGPAAAPLVWQCWLEDGSTTLACAQEGRIVDAIFDDPVLHHGVANDGVPDRPAILKAGSVTAALRAQPALATAQPVVWRTPLYSPAHDDEFTALLARSVMCGRQPDCRALFRPSPPGLEAQDQDALQLAGRAPR